MNTDTPALEISPVEVKRRLDAGEPTFLLDVRQPEETAICQVAGAELIPMNSIPLSLQTIEAKADEALVVVYCHHGMRSLNVVNWLRGQGVTACTSLSGGIDRWSLEIDPNVPRY